MRRGFYKLRWINAAISNFGPRFKMMELGKQKAAAARARIEPDMVSLTGRLGLATVPAVWPTGVSQLAQAIDACGDTAGRGLNVEPTRRLF